MNPQHAFQAHRWTACAFGFGIKRFDDLAQAMPGNNLFHLVQKLVTAGGLALAFKTFISKSLLAHSTGLRAA